MRVRMCLRTCMRANTVAVYTPGKSHCYSHSVVRTFSLSAQLFPFHHPGQFCVLWFTLSLCQCAGKFQPKHLATFKGNKQKISAWFSNSNLQSMVQTKLNCKQTTVTNWQKWQGSKKPHRWVREWWQHSLLYIERKNDGSTCYFTLMSERNMAALVTLHWWVKWW